MLIGHDIIVPRLPKCSTTSLMRLMSEMEVGGFISAKTALPIVGRTLPMHGGWHMLPEKLRGRYIAGTVRNAWGWYPSWFHYFITEKGEIGNMMKPFIALDSSGEPDFKASLARMLYPEEHGLDKLDEPMVFIGDLDRKIPLLRYMRQPGIGFYSFWYLWIYARDPLGTCMGMTLDELLSSHDELVAQRAIMDHRCIQRDLPAIMRGAGFELTEDQLRIVAEAKQRNVNRAGAAKESRSPSSRHYSGTYEDYYDDESRGWVAERDRLVIDRYDQSFSDEAPPAPFFFDQPEASIDRTNHFTVQDALSMMRQRIEQRGGS